MVHFDRLQSDIGIDLTVAEWGALRRARHSDIRVFYVELRRALVPEYRTRLPFTLPCRELAERTFLPGRRDRKLYARLWDEMIRVGLIHAVAPSTLNGQGKRAPAIFVFGASNQKCQVVNLADYR